MIPERNLCFRLMDIKELIFYRVHGIESNFFKYLKEASLLPLASIIHLFLMHGATK